MGGRLLDWLGAGLAADRPLATDMPARIVPDSTAFYFQKDTSILSIFDESGPAWFDIDAAALAAIAFLTLPDVDATGLADGNVFKWNVATSKLIPLALAFQTAESIQDLIGAMIVNGTGTNGSYDDTAGTFKFDSTITQYTDEAAMDAIATAFAAGTHTGLTITYDDALNKFSFAVSGATYTDENAQDAVAAMIAAGSHTGITVGYNDAGNALSFTVTVTQYTDEMARDAIGTALVGVGANTITVDDPGDQIKIVGNGNLSPILPNVAMTGFYYTPFIISTTTVSMTANQIFYMPVVIPVATTLTQLALNIVSTGAGQEVRLGLYAPRSLVDTRPGLLLVDAGTIDISTGAGTTKTLATSVVVNPGTYLLAMAIKGSLGTLMGCAPLPPVAGRSLIGGASNTIGMYFRVFTYAALPADESAQTMSTSGNGYLIGIK